MIQNEKIIKQKCLVTQYLKSIGESLNIVCKRFLDAGMSIEEIANGIDVPVKFVLVNCK